MDQPAMGVSVAALRSRHCLRESAAPSSGARQSACQSLLDATSLRETSGESLPLFPCLLSLLPPWLYRRCGRNGPRRASGPHHRPQPSHATLSVRSLSAGVDGCRDASPLSATTMASAMGLSEP